MVKELLVLVTILLCVPCAGFATSQETGEERITEQEVACELGRNLAVNLVVEPGEDKEGITIITATERFAVSIETDKDGKGIKLHLQGQIRLSDDQRILVSYEVRIHGIGSQGQFAFKLEGSALLEEGNQVIIAKSKDIVLKLRVGGV